MKMKNTGVIMLLIGICVVASVLNPFFLSVSNIQNTANMIGLYGIFTLGVGMVILVGGIDLSVGSMFALLGVVLVHALSYWQWPWFLTALVIVALGTVLGSLHGHLINRFKLPSFMVTLCGLLIYRGLARFLDETQRMSIYNKLEQALIKEDMDRVNYYRRILSGLTENEGFEALSQLLTGTIGGVPKTFVLLVFIAAVLWVILHRSRYGRHLLAVGRNEQAARLSGINVNRVRAIAFMISGGLAGLASIALAFYTETVAPSQHGIFYEFYAIAAVVIGGCSLRGGEGTVLGMLAGVAIIQVLQNVVNLVGIPSSLNFAVLGTVILLAILMDQIAKLGRARKPGPASRAS